MSNIPSARSSPRIVNGVLKWYEFDTFTLDLELELEDQDGEPVTIGTDDIVEINFYNRSEDKVKEWHFTNISSNVVTLVFDDEVTALFPAGWYHYDIIYKGENRTTIAKRVQLIVEEE